ncbi:MAG: hypothetical protein IKP86_11125, partial [Anaerolineaceae bacterium]|nr:hypothetical protein [Anaerolineaceae bacterium]
MKKYLPLLFIFILALTGIAAADAPFEITVDLANEGGSYYNNSLILFSGGQLSIRLDEYDVVLTVQEKQDEGLNFTVEPDLESKGSSQGVAVIGAFLLPE